MDSRKLNGTMADFQWHIEAGVNYLNEFINPITLKMRSAIETDTDWDFRYYIEEVPVKIDSNTFFNLVVSSATAAVKGENATEIRRGDLDSNTVVFGIDVKYEDKDVPAFRIYVLKSNQDLDSEDSVEISTLYLHCAGGKQFVEKFVSIFTEELKNTHTAAKAALVRWIFSSRNGARNKTFQIRKTWDIDRCFYPWINSDLNAYYKAFLESRAQILILYGEPGTGKTSFIRDMICETGMNAYISYDLDILSSDSTFVYYLTDKLFDAIVIEDADDLLTSGRGNYNKVISKILNISDGLIKLPQKKLIFSTNLKTVDEIDSAIIRPGRCFDMMEFRKFTVSEARAVAEHIGVPTDTRGHTLAEIFAQKELQSVKDPLILSHDAKKPVFGFNQ